MRKKQAAKFWESCRESSERFEMPARLDAFIEIRGTDMDDGQT